LSLWRRSLLFGNRIEKLLSFRNHMKSIVSLLVLWLAVSALPAQVPHLITYQGRVSSTGQPFSGTGQFKFALVGNAGTPVFWRNDGGAGAGEPAVAVNIPVTNGLFTIVLGDAGVPGMAALPPGLFNNSAVYVRIWFNDGVNGFAQLSPDQRITAVGYALMADGVRAGSITGASIAAGAIDGSKLAAGAAASNLLASGRSSLVSGGIVLSAQEHATNLLNEGYAKLAQVPLVEEKWRSLTNGPPVLQKALQRKGHVALWTGTEMIIWGGQSDTEAFNTGGRYNPTTDTWTLMSTNGAPSPQIGASAVWTGSNLVVWGNSGPVRGARYNPSSDTWSAMSTVGAPNPRTAHSVVWTGTYMILWGGLESGVYLNNGFRYNPSTDAWSPVSASSLAIRAYHSAVAAGTEMIVWGGSETHSCGFLCSFRTNYNDGARYNPSSNTWQPMTTAGAPQARSDHSAVWTGAEMVIWGGKSGSGTFAFGTNINSGARYNPSLNSWTPMTSVGAPSPRQIPAMFWTGNRVLLWGGVDDDTGGTNVNNGARYNPANNTWLAMTTTNAPAPRGGHTAVFSGAELILWGGQQLNEPGTFDDEYVEVGYRYHATLDSWSTMSPSGEPAARFDHTAIWTGKEMIVWGGDGGEFLLRSGGKLDPNRPLPSAWSTVSSTGAPTARISHTAVWTGAEMLVWGGHDGSAALNTGGRYNLNLDSWSAITTNAAPLARQHHVAVWTGTEMLVWGGNNGSTYYNNGGRYTPATGTWTAMPLAGAPAARSGATAIWTGSEMIVWGGLQVSGGFPPIIFLFNSGARFNPANNTWTPLPTANAPSGRINHSAVWTGTDMIVWGGDMSGSENGARYNLAENSWTPLPTVDEPASRRQHTAVWDGTQMIIWGGHNGTNEVNTGGVYDPIANTWRAVTTTGAPVQRVGHTAVWAGAEMVVWGGRQSSQTFDDTFGYTPARTMFLYLKP
jgi:N-acetylneuraminic acid mutarotase